MIFGQKRCVIKRLSTPNFQVAVVTILILRKLVETELFLRIMIIGCIINLIDKSTDTDYNTKSLCTDSF